MSQGTTQNRPALRCRGGVTCGVLWTHLAPRAASWGNLARRRGIPPGHLTRLRRSLRRDMEGVESLSRTGRARSFGRQKGQQ
jgi:hypothetical protein